MNYRDQSTPYGCTNGTDCQVRTTHAHGACAPTPKPAPKPAHDHEVRGAVEPIEMVFLTTGEAVVIFAFLVLMTAFWVIGAATTAGYLWERWLGDLLIKIGALAGF